MINGKKKGNSQERKIANILSERFEIKTGLTNSFRRNVDSGSFFGGSNMSRTDTHDLSKATFGDIVCPNNFKYSVESKFYAKAPGLSGLLKQDIKEWDGWIDQAKQDSVNANKEMALIIKYNNVEEFVILEKLPKDLENSSKLKYKNYFIVTLKDFLSIQDNEFFI